MRLKGKYRRIAAWICIVCALAYGVRTFRNRIPKWSDIEYDRFDGRIILRNFESRFSSIMAANYDRKHNEYVVMPMGSQRSETIPTRSVFCIINFHYRKKVEPFWKRLKSSQAEIETKGIYLKRSDVGEYLGSHLSKGNFRDGKNPGSYGWGSSDIPQNSRFNGPLFADAVGPLKKNSRLFLNQDFYFVQVYDQFRVYTVDDLPWSIRNLMKGRINWIFGQEAGNELTWKDAPPPPDVIVPNAVN